MAIPQLVLGSFNLTDWAGVTYGTSVIAQGTSRGAPVPIEVAVKSWLQDGSIVVTQGYDNRTVNIRVKLRGPSLTSVSQAEAALFAEIGKPNTLTWTPASGPATVFVVVTSSMEESPGDEGDIAEALATPWRTYNLRLLCEAFTRSVAQVTAQALPTSGSTTTVLDAMAATTGWTGTADGASVTVTNASGANSVTLSNAAEGEHALTMQKTFAAPTGTTKLLMVDWKPSHFGGTFSATGDGVSLPLMAEKVSPTSGYVRSYFYVAASSLAVTVLRWDGKRQDLTPTSFALSVDNVSVTNAYPTVGTGRQLMRSLQVAGSARTIGSLSVESETTALGDALIYVFPSTETTFGHSPSLRQFRTSGNTVTANSALISGSSEPLTGSGVVFSIPIGMLPAGSYVLMGRLSASSSGASLLTINAATLFSGKAVGSTTVLTSPVLTTVMTTYALATLQLPNVDVPQATSGLMEVKVTGSVNTPTYDEFWLFNQTIGALVWVDCGTGTPAPGGPDKRIFMEPATPTTPRNTIRVGHSTDRSDAYHPQTLKSWDFPMFPAGQVNVLAVTSNATDAVVTLRYYPRWHTNAAS